MNRRIRGMPAVLALCLASRLAAGGDRFPAKGGDIEITPLVHASVQVEYAGKVTHQDFASHAIKGPLPPRWIAPGLSVAQSLQVFKEALKGTATEVRLGRWYP